MTITRTHQQSRPQTSDVNQMYATIGKVVVDATSTVISAVRNVYDSLKNNAPLLQSIAFTSVLDEHLGADMDFENHFQPFFQSMGPAFGSAFGHHTIPRTRRSQPIIEEISDDDSPPARHSKSNSHHHPSDVKREDTPDPRSFAKSVKRLKLSPAKQVHKPTKPTKPASKPPIKKDIVLDSLTPAKVEKERPKGQLYEGVPEDVHIDEAFMKDLEKLSGSGKSLTAQVMPALGVCVSKLKKF